MTDSRSVPQHGSGFARTADSCALTASNELPRSRNSSPGSSSDTSSSPRPSRVSPLWITWIGRSIHCESMTATNDAMQQRDEDGAERGVEGGLELVLDQDRGDADADRSELLVAGQQRLADFEGLVRVHRPSCAIAPAVDHGAEQSCSGSGCPSCVGNPCAITTPWASTIAA